MRTLHLAPGLFAAGTLRQALRDAGRDDEVLALHDDLSCGPIHATDAGSRSTWSSQIFDDDIGVIEASIAAFWDRLAAATDPIVVWAGRRSGSEFAFLLAVAHALGDRAFRVVDVPQSDYVTKGGPDMEPCAVVCVGILSASSMRGLIGTERAVSPDEHAAMRERWQVLQRENAPFRIATESALISVPETYFDADLLAEASATATKVARVVGGAMASARGWIQVGDGVLIARVAALVATGRLVAEGDPRDIHAWFVRLPG